jgi:hypothetical protein
VYLTDEQRRRPGCIAGRMQQAFRDATLVCRARPRAARIAAGAAWSDGRAAGAKLWSVAADGKHRQLFCEVVTMTGRAREYCLFPHQELELVMAGAAFVFEQRHN